MVAPKSKARTPVKKTNGTSNRYTDVQMKDSADRNASPDVDISNDAEESGSEIFEGVDGDEDDEDMVDGAMNLELDDEDEDEDEEDDFSEEDSEDDGGAPLSPSEAPLIGNEASIHPLTAPAPSITLSATEVSANPELHPEKPTPYTFDAGNLLVNDPNPLPQTTAANMESTLASVARDATQSLLNHLLTTCPIKSSSQAVMMTLPPPTTPMPREKPIPQPKPPTKWERFAAKKGINKNKQQQGEGRAGKMVFDQDTGEWVPRYGYKGKNKAADSSWLVEVDQKKEDARRGVGKPAANADENPRNADRAERKARVKRNERLQRANDRRVRTKGA